MGELTVYHCLLSPSVRTSVLSSVNVFKKKSFETNGTIEIKSHVETSFDTGMEVHVCAMVFVMRPK